MIRRSAVAALMLVLTAGLAQAQSNSTLFSGFGTGSKDPVQVEADSLEVVDQKTRRVSSFRGNVTVVQAGTTLKASAITIYSSSGDNAAGKTEAFDRIEASGKVYVRSADQVATGDAATFDAKAQTAVLTGNIVLTQQGNVITGDRLTIDIRSGRARLDQNGGGRVKGIFTPSADMKGKPRS